MGLFGRWSINLLFVTASLVYLAGLGVDVMEVDAAQYASMSREMAETGSYLEVHHRGQDYLDKPPFIFWVSSVWIKIFGPYNWAYKLSSFLFSILGIVSTYKLGHLLYNKRIGFIAAIMLVTSQAYFLFNNDIRTDTILTAAVIFAVWQIMSYIFYHNKWHLVGGFVGIGIGMLTKGPIAIMVPVLALASYFIGRKRYREFFRVDWLWGLLILAVMLAPMSWGLYQQFDKHPEKELLFLSDAGNVTKTNVSGLKFYFWTQSFGRITGENVWKDNSPPTFFIDNFLWSFMPWAILAFWALFWRIGSAAIDFFKGNKKQEWLTLGGFVLPFIAFSMSNYKLPHYIFVLYPFAAIITAEFVLRVLFERPKWWGSIMQGVQLLVIIGITGLGILLLAGVFGQATWWIWVIYLAIVALMVFSIFHHEVLNRVVMGSAFAIIAFNWVMNTHFYPKLLEFQPGHEAAKFVAQNEIPKSQIFINGGFAFYSFGFYADDVFYDAYGPRFENALEIGPAYVCTTEDQVAYYQENFENAEIVASFPTFHITKLNVDFLNPATRDATLKKEVIIKISKI